MLDPDFAVNKEILFNNTHSKEIIDGHNFIAEFLSGKLHGSILDIGERNPLTIKLEKRFNCKIDNTSGDLDIYFCSDKHEYDVILFSHVIEHLFNPLSCLLQIKTKLKDDGTLYIATPRCPENLKLNWTTGHFHEFDEYRMGKLLKRAGFNIVDKTYYKRNIGGFNGIRPILKKLLYKNVIYTVVKA